MRFSKLVQQLKIIQQYHCILEENKRCTMLIG